MKKLYILLLFIFSAINCCLASSLEFVPTMNDKTDSQNRLWTASFQLGWNDLTNKIVQKPVKFIDNNLALVENLNKQYFVAKDLSDVEHYYLATKIKPFTKWCLKWDLRSQFKYRSNLLKQTKLTARNDRALVYGFLRKDVYFPVMFDVLGEGDFGSGEKTLYYGVDSNTKANFREYVDVLFYNSSEDFCIVLKTTNSDLVYLYRTSEDKSFAELYSDMMFKGKRYYDDVKLSEIDELKIPSLNFNEEQIFDELSGKLMLGMSLGIDKAMESVTFSMNNIGKESVKDSNKTSTIKALYGEVQPRSFILDDTFVIFIKNKYYEKPYFALRVNNISLFK